MSTLNEDMYDEINAELARLAQISIEEETPEKVFIGTGDDCTIVLFGGNYKPLEVHV